MSGSDHFPRDTNEEDRRRGERGPARRRALSSTAGGRDGSIKEPERRPLRCRRPAIRRTFLTSRSGSADRTRKSARLPASSVPRSPSMPSERAAVCVAARSASSGGMPGADVEVHLDRDAEAGERPHVGAERDRDAGRAERRRFSRRGRETAAARSRSSDSARGSRRSTPRSGTARASAAGRPPGPDRARIREDASRRTRACPPGTRRCPSSGRRRPAGLHRGDRRGVERLEHAVRERRGPAGDRLLSRPRGSGRARIARRPCRAASSEQRRGDVGAQLRAAAASARGTRPCRRA